MGEWKNRLSHGLVMILTLAVAGSGMSSAVPSRSTEDFSGANDSLVGVSLADIDEVIQGEAAISQEQLQAVAYASDGKGLKSNDAAVYKALKTCIEDVARGKKTSTEFTLKTRYSESQLAQMDVNTIVAYLLNDCPFDLYWHDKTETEEDGKATDGVYCKYYKDGRIVFSFKVAEPYRKSPDDLYTVNSASMDTVIHAAEKARSIVDTNRNNADYEKLLAYRNAICDLVYYDDMALFDPVYGNSYQVISVFDDDPNTNVVCEGYAKAFKYLCDLSSFDNDIECYTVSGTTDAGAGEHMWNILRIGGGNGESYLVDVTNCDTGTIGEGTQLFMADNPAGSVETGYSFTCGWDSITYTYKEEAKQILGKELLSLENENHDAEVQTHTTDPENNDNPSPAPFDGKTDTTSAEPQEETTEQGTQTQAEENAGTAEEDITGSAFGFTELEKVYGDEDFTETVQNADSSKLTYKSSNTDVAKVTKRGKVSILGVGTTTITAEDSKGIWASYTLKVSPKVLEWDISELYAIDNEENVRKDGTASLYGEIKLEGILPEDKDRNSQFSFDSDDLTGTYMGTRSGVQDVLLKWKEGKEVKLTAGRKSDNYEMPEKLPTIQGKITTINRLADPPESVDGLKMKLEMEDGLSKVPEGLESIRDLNTPVKIEKELKTKLNEYAGIPEENIVVYDVTLSCLDKAKDDEDDEGSWMTVDDLHFPEEGITVTLPYPGEMPRNVDDIVVCHMFAEDMYNSSPGEIEYPVVEEVNGGIQFKVYGLSPVAVGWTEDAEPQTTQAPEQGVDQENTQNNENQNQGQQNNQNNQNGQTDTNRSPVTGDNVQIILYAVLVLVCAVTIRSIQVVRRRKKKR